MTRRYFYTLLFTFALALGTSLDATIIWSNCPAGSLSMTGVCPLPGEDCGDVVEDEPINKCSCDLRPQYHWEGDEETGTCEE